MRSLLVNIVGLGLFGCALTTQPEPEAKPSPRRGDLAAIEARFQQAAFEYVEAVVRVRVDGSTATVLEQLRGPALGRQPPLRERLPKELAGEHFVAVDRCGRSPGLCPRSWLPVTEENRRLVEAWALPTWKHSPLVAVVRVTQAPAPSGLVTFDVLKVLRGEWLAPQVAANAWAVEAFLPLVAEPAQYLLEASTSSRDRLPVVSVRSLTPIAAEGVSRLEDAMELEPFSSPGELVAMSRAAIEAVERGWLAHEAPLVAEARVGTTYSDLWTAAGGYWSTLVPSEWFRGRSGPLSTEVPVRGFGPPATPIPYLFLEGGHGEYRVLSAPSYLVAGWNIGGPAALVVESGTAARAELLQALEAPAPRFAARPVDDLQHLQPAPEGDASLFEPALPLEAFAVETRLESTRFEVVDRGELPGGGAWIRCRSLEPKRVDEWLFEGRDLPDWPVGARIIGRSIIGRRQSSWLPSLAERHALFLPDLFVPGDSPIDDVRTDMSRYLPAPR